MEPVLDETSLVPCKVWLPVRRVRHLAQTLKALDRLGVPRVLRSVRDAAHRDISAGHGLRFWCFQPGMDRDAGRFVAQRLARQPYIDGRDGLFTEVEGSRAIEAKVDGIAVIGLGLAALEGSIAVAVGGAGHSKGRVNRVELLEYDGDHERTSIVRVPSLVLRSDVEQNSGDIVARLDQSVRDGKLLVERLPEMFPKLVLGPKARAQIQTLLGSEPVFRQLIRHLRALDKAAERWTVGKPFNLTGVTHSDESIATLQHRRYGPMRDFQAPDGFAARRWTSHTKLTGGSGARLYFAVEQRGSNATVLVGYFGKHLPCMRFPN